MTNTRRVVVTGIGLVSSLGIGTDANWQALIAGRSGVDTITKFDVSQFATQIAGEVKGFDPLQYIEKKDVKKMDVFIQYAIAASQFAMDDAGVSVTEVRRHPEACYAMAKGPDGLLLELFQPEAAQVDRRLADAGYFASVNGVLS